MTNEEAHRLAREKGVSRLLYAVVRGVFVPFMRLWWGLRITNAERIPVEGAAIVTPNHKSFFDSFFIAAATRRHVRFMGKSELFEGRAGRLLLSLGGFPVRRGASDAEAVETALAILRRGDALALFPEGTRVADPETLGIPRKGAARLAIEGGAPIVPTAISGTEKRRWPLPRRVQVSFGEPIPVADLKATPEDAGRLIEETVWPVISEDYKRLRARPGLIAGGLAAVGIGYAVHRFRKRN